MFDMTMVWLIEAFDLDLIYCTVPLPHVIGWLDICINGTSVKSVIIQKYFHEM